MTEVAIEKKVLQYQNAVDRALKLSWSNMANAERFERANFLLHLFRAKLDAYCEMKWMLITDPITKAWHQLGDAYMEAYEEYMGASHTLADWKGIH